mmetsp:Transcript_17829/g.44963  ORF Transcript_17829/g.44963 Transcript_17829/m.44963 type:complete len:289 (-) Transcript_17829:252-1118(-)
MRGPRRTAHAPHPSLQEFELLDEIKLLGDLHKRGQREHGVRVGAGRDLGQGVVERHELKVVKLPRGELVVVLHHRLPRPVPHPNHDNGQRIVGRLDNSLLRILAVCDLAIGDDHEDVVALLFLDNFDRLADDGPEVGRPREGDLGGYLVVARNDLLEGVAWAPVREKGESLFVCRVRVPEAKRGNELVVIEHLERAADDLDNRLIGVLHSRGAIVEALATKALLPGPGVGLGEVDAEDQVRGLEAGLSQRLLDLLNRLIVVLDRVEGGVLGTGLHGSAVGSPMLRRFL